MTKDELHKSVNPGQLMQALEWDFANIRIEIADSDLQKAFLWRCKDVAGRTDAGIEGQACPTSVLSRGMERTLYHGPHQNAALLHASGCRLRKRMLGIRQQLGSLPEQGRDGAMLLLAWNGSLEQGVEFQIDFDNKEGEYLVLEYEFSNSVLDVLSQFPAESMKAMTHILCPALSAAMLRRGEEGLPFKIGPGKAGILSITKK